MFNKLDSLSVVDLRKICRDENIHKYSKLRKKDMLKLINTHRINIMVKDGIDTLMKLKK